MKKKVFRAAEEFIAIVAGIVVAIIHPRLMFLISVMVMIWIASPILWSIAFRLADHVDAEWDKRVAEAADEDSCEMEVVNNDKVIYFSDMLTEK